MKRVEADKKIFKEEGARGRRDFKEEGSVSVTPGHGRQLNKGRLGWPGDGNSIGQEDSNRVNKPDRHR